MVSRALLAARALGAALLALSTATFSAPAAAQQTGGPAEPFTVGLWGDRPYARSGDTPRSRP